MKAVEDNGRPAIRMSHRDEFGEIGEVLHVIDIDSARRLRDELTDVIKKCVVMEAVKLNR